MLVSLNEEQRRYALMIAENRRNASKRKGHQDRHGIRDDDGSLDRTGACGELAAAIALGLNQRLTVNTFKGEPDLVFRGWPVEVRTARSKRAKLFFRDRDDPDSIMLLVLEIENTWVYEMAGWALGCEIRDSGTPSGAANRPLFPAFGVDELTRFDLIFNFEESRQWTA